MQNAISLANAEIAEIRRKNEKERRRREDEVRSSAPEFNEVERSLAAGGLALARAVLEGRSDISKIREGIEAAQAKKAVILARLSLPGDYLDDIYSCRFCRDTGYDLNGRRCSCLKNMIAKYTVKISNLSEAMKEQTFEKFNFLLFANQPDSKGRSVAKVMKNIYEKAKTFADGLPASGENLYLYGAAGTGKTYISSCIANRALEKGCTVYYASAFGLMDMLERLKFGRYDEADGEDAEYISRYIYTVDLLIIDDVGTEFVSGYSSSVLFDIINSRLISGKSTVISSNLSPDKINDIYGARMESRIIGAFKPMRFIGNDLRRNYLKKNS